MSLFRTLKNIVKRICDRRPKIEAKIVSLAKNELLKDRVILITGGSGGIGYSIAKTLLDSGAFVIITGRNQEKLESASKRLSDESKTSNIICQAFDNSDYLEFDSFFEKLLVKLSSLGINKIDALVNNAGINSNETFPNVSPEMFDKIITTNLKSVVFISQFFAKYMVTNKISGNILNINSVSSVRPNNTIYGVSKRGMLGLTMGMAKTLAPKGIVVNGIAPGPVATEMLGKENAQDISLYSSLLGRFIMPDEIANMALFLLSNMGRCMIGETVFMSAGAGRLTVDDVPYEFDCNVG